ncbi:alpha-2-macroglobulin-like protein 1 [Alosa pseudoharengus]|uniref:alpha-2-macroglobulin-like protein 1 n=1 Tax=Alosa pseudoharengus TaxID=34774 RepID=UPI003F8AA0AF
MDTEFIPLQQKDPRGNTIGQWLNVSSERKMLQLSHALNPEADQGYYMLSVTGEQGAGSHQFQVKQYVLPKFDVTLNSPESVSVGAAEIRLQACAKYTFGAPVPGKATLSLCRESDIQGGDGVDPTLSVCWEELVEMDKSGCGCYAFYMATFTQQDLNKKLRDILIFKATVVEEGTGISRSEVKNIDLDFSLGKLSFVDTPNVIEDGAVMEGKIKATHYNDTGIAGRMVHLFKGPRWNAELLLNLTTDSAGVAQFSLNTAPFPRDFELFVVHKLVLVEDPGIPPFSSLMLLPFQASLTTDTDTYRPYNTPYYDSESKSVSRLRTASPDSASSSSLSIIDDKIDGALQCGKDVPITIKYTFTGETFNADSVDVIYMVLSRGQIVHHGFAEASVKGSPPVTQGEVSFRLSVSVEMAPSVQVLAYCVLPSETFLADSKTFSTEKCFVNKVSVQFSPPKSVPGEKSSLQLSAQPGSLCGLSAVDQSIYILEPGKRLNADKVFDLLPSMDSFVDYEVEDPVECLKRLGLKAVTNLVLGTPDCLLYRGETYHKGFGYPKVAFESAAIAAPVAPVPENVGVTVRTIFPETWIWDLAEVGGSGETQVPLTVPDTITTWEMEAFCLSPQGFGLAPPVQLTVFQPFFLELSLPYSIIRGETFELKATVFNYLSQCIMVLQQFSTTCPSASWYYNSFQLPAQVHHGIATVFNYLPKCIMVTVTPTPSSDFTLTPSSDGQYSSCLCADGRKTFKWTLVPSVLGEMSVTVSAAAGPSQTLCGNEVLTVPERGRVDAVTRSLKVKAEGTERVRSFSLLLCPKGGALTEEVELTLPGDVVKGSARASVSVLGDIIGRALKNIDSLLQMPYGCGEQNMAILSPNIYIMQYLQNTGQLTADIKEKATNFLKSGYQRQLNYKLPNGAYSTFGTGDGNTWLTAFVLRSFGKAKSFIYIDPKVITDASTWLGGNLRPDGVFNMQGKLFNNRMKGGVSDDVTITAYIAASMLELNMSTVTQETMRFLKSSASKRSNTYTTALLAYTFSLAGEADLRAELLKHLDSVATSAGSLLHWSQSSSEQADSLAVETSAYVLLAVLTKPALTAADLGYASRIVNWLVKQQNPYGGFSSTQDTVVALQALALYATKVFSPHGSSTVTVRSAGGDTHQFDVNQLNTLLYQEGALRHVPGKYRVDVKGSACASVGVALFYNIPTPSKHSTLSITTQAKPLTEGQCNKADGQQAFSLHITVQYNGPLQSTNMAIIDVKILSGFTADTEKLQGSRFVDRVDSKDDHILVYLSEVPKDIPVHCELTIRQDLPVTNLKPAGVKVYDYYQTSDQAEAEYSSPCAGQGTAEGRGH